MMHPLKNYVMSHSLSPGFHSFNVNISISVLKQNVFIISINSSDLSVMFDYIIIFNKHLLHTIIKSYTYDINFIVKTCEDLTNFFTLWFTRKKIN
ncbi:hypothetical protein FWK35_00023929, partial [Aphis craccivora]